MFNIIGQMVSIVMNLAIIAFIALRFKNMQYGFWTILIRYIFYGDDKPMRWLSDHIIYLYYLIFEFGKFITFLGLVQQLRLDRLSERMPEFFISSPLNNVMIALIFMEHFKLIDTITFFNKSGYSKIITLINKQINKHIKF